MDGSTTVGTRPWRTGDPGRAMETPLQASLIRRVHLRMATHVALLKARRQSAYRTRRLPFRRVLVLCYGNIYRSPFVAAYIARGLGAPGCPVVRSAGFHPKVGRRTPDDFVALARDRTGIDLSGHRSTRVSREDFEWADMVLIMDRHNWHATASAAAGADALNRVVWMGALAGTDPVEIEDPYGGSAAVQIAIIDKLIESADQFCRIIRARNAVASDAGGTGA